MNFLAHCLIADKAAPRGAVTRWTEQAAGQPFKADLPNPPMQAPAKQANQSAQEEDLSRSINRIVDAAEPRLEQAPSRPSVGRFANGGGAVPGLADGLIAGGLLGDFIKGPVPSAWPNALQLGVRLHRRIDAYSNAAPELRRSYARFPPELRRFAPIFVDVIADHCLALDWADHHPAELPAFSAHCYALAAAEAHRLHGDGRRCLSWLIERDLMSGYRNYEVMERGLKSVTRRLARQHLDASLLDFVGGALPSLRADFQGYFPLLVAHGREQVKEAASKAGPAQ